MYLKQRDVLGMVSNACNLSTLDAR
jgi:hypothetical protein